MNGTERANPVNSICCFLLKLIDNLIRSGHIWSLSNMHYCHLPTLSSMDVHQQDNALRICETNATDIKCKWIISKRIYWQAQQQKKAAAFGIRDARTCLTPTFKIIRNSQKRYHRLCAYICFVSIARQLSYTCVRHTNTQPTQNEIILVFVWRQRVCQRLCSCYLYFCWHSQIRQHWSSQARYHHNLPFLARRIHNIVL